MKATPRPNSAFVFALASAIACAAQAPAGKSENAKPVIDQAPLVSVAPATNYDTLEHPSPAATGNTVEAWIDEEVRVLAAPKRGTPLSRDARLDRVATDLAKSRSPQDYPTVEQIAQETAYHGFPVSILSLVLFQGSTTLDRASLSPIKEQLSTLRAQGEPRRYGLGFATMGNVLVGIVVASDLSLELAPIPRRLELGQTASIVGRVLPPFSLPEVLVTMPTGKVEHLASSGQDNHFAARLPCQSATGIHRVEIMGTNAGGPTVLANFPIYCGIAPPLAVEASKLAAPTENRASEVEERLYSLLNEERKNQGLSPLHRNAKLAQAARAYSQELSDYRYREVAHISPRTGSVVDRVRKAGLTQRPDVLAENLARVYSASEAHQGFLGSPGHRANMVHPRLTDVGIGVVADADTNGPRAFYVTEIFAAFAP